MPNQVNYLEGDFVSNSLIEKAVVKLHNVPGYGTKLVFQNTFKTPGDRYRFLADARNALDDLFAYFPNWKKCPVECQFTCANRRHAYCWRERQVGLPRQKWSDVL